MKAENISIMMMHELSMSSKYVMLKIVAFENMSFYMYFSFGCPGNQ